MKHTLWTALSVAAFAVASVASGGTAAATATLDLRGPLEYTAVFQSPCPPGTPDRYFCPSRNARGLVPGLGAVTTSYNLVFESEPPDCPLRASRVFGYAVRWAVAGKGEITFAVAPNPDCLAEFTGFLVPQSFTVTGGTGAYAGASGSGRIERTGVQTADGAQGVETWLGTVVVPGLEFDLTAPSFGAVRGKTVRAPRGATRVRVTYAVTARDAVDGPVRPRCTPASGSRFKLGRTVVRCTAVDTSGNSASARFVVTVRR